MIPNNDGLQADFVIDEQPTYTYKLNMSGDRVIGYTDRLEAMKQAIYLILNIERYEYLIYSWNYGVELVDLIGQPIPFVLPEIERRITEALLQDDRIEAVHSFEFERIKKDKIHVTFQVDTIFGTVNAERVVNV